MEKLITISGVVLVIFVVSVAVTIPAGLVSYWKMEEGVDFSVFDSADGNNGAVFGPTWVPGIEGFALSFDGDDYVSFGNPSNLKIYPPLSGEVWVKPFTHNLSGFRIAPPCLCVNGELENSVIGNLEPDYESRVSNVSLQQGVEQSYMWCSAFWFKGVLDEVAIYVRALPEEEIWNHYRNGLAGMGYDADVIQADIDINPGSDPNAINLKSGGYVPVAIFSTETFDATTVDPATITLAGAP